MYDEQPEVRRMAAAYNEMRDQRDRLQAEVERLRGEVLRAQDAFRVIGYSPAYEQQQYAFDLGADEPGKGYSHWSWYPIAIARFMFSVSSSDRASGGTCAAQGD